MNQDLSPRQVVEQFFAALQSLDIDAVDALVSDSCDYRNMPLHRARGKARVMRDLKLMSKPLNRFEVQMLNISENGDVVLTERVDLISGPGFRLEIPLMGVLRVERGQIVEWRDYLDFTSCSLRMLGSLLMSPFRALRG